MSDNSYEDSVKDDKFQDYQGDYRDDDGSDLDDDHADDHASGGRGKKKYSVIPQSVREKFINRVLSKEVTIKEAAKEFGLKFSTSKAILQTYKKEGRIGKKKNRERKTKILNVVFICNVNHNNPYASSVYPIVSVNESKGNKGLANAEANKNKLVESALANYPDHKVVHQTHMQIPHDSNKTTQSYIKDLGNDFLKDFIEKNYSAGKIPLNEMHQYPNPNGGANSSNSMNPPSLNNVGNMGHLGGMGNMANGSGLQSHSYNGISSLNGGSMMVPQQTFSMGSNLPQITGLGNFNQFGSHHGLNQKRPFHGEMMNDFELKNEQISDMSVKKFKSGEDSLWDMDLDKSKRDLEDFIYKTQNAIKNNTYVEKNMTFDFSKYKDEFNE